MAQRIALLADGSNLKHQYRSGPERPRELYPVLNIAFYKLESIGDVVLRMLYMDEEDSRALRYASGFGFEEKSIGVKADPWIRRGIRSVCKRKDIDIICIGSGDHFFEQDIPVIMEHDKEPCIMGLEKKISWKLCRHGPKIITIYEDEIRGFDTAAMDYLRQINRKEPRLSEYLKSQ